MVTFSMSTDNNLTRKLLDQGFLLVKLKSSLRFFYGRHHDLVDRCGISVSQMTTICSTSWSFPHSRLITGCVTRLTRPFPLVEKKLLTLPEHLSSLPVFSEVCVTRSFIRCCRIFFDIRILIVPLVSSNSSYES